MGMPAQRSPTPRPRPASPRMTRYGTAPKNSSTQCSTPTHFLPNKNPMKVFAAVAALWATLVLVGAASATTFGITDDAGKYANDGGASFFSALNDLGMNENRVTVQWDPAHPTTIVEQAFLDRSVPQALFHGVDLVFAI